MNRTSISNTTFLVFLGRLIQFSLMTIKQFVFDNPYMRAVYYQKELSYSQQTSCRKIIKQTVEPQHAESILRSHSLFDYFTAAGILAIRQFVLIIYSRTNWCIKKTNCLIVIKFNCVKHPKNTRKVIWNRNSTVL